MIEALPAGGTAVVPEEPLLEPYLTRTDIAIRRFGHVDEPGVFQVAGRTIRLETSYTARHQLDNTLAALVVCDVLGIAVGDGELTVEFSALREEEIALPDDVLLINDCYNANPLSMRAALVPERAAGSPSSGRWRSWAGPRRPTIARSAPPRPSSASTS